MEILVLDLLRCMKQIQSMVWTHRGTLAPYKLEGQRSTRKVKHAFWDNGGAISIDSLRK